MGRKKGKGEGFRPAVKPNRRVLCSGIQRGGAEASRVAENSGGVAGVWERESNYQGSLTPPKCKSCLRGAKFTE